ncbi:hypothetical protein CoNPh35_CDS0043 [Staphylococcus phage S-CoN_Ph35]|nr:hypothetical protein CoNPh35_CDS0043 [Staphylococcus phage S-CoN_Ph35]
MEKRQPADDNQVTNGQRVWVVYRNQRCTNHTPTNSWLWIQ